MKKPIYKRKVFLISFCLFAMAALWWWFFSLPKELFDAPTSTVVLDASGQLLAARIAQDEQYRFPMSDDVPSKFATCITAFEDREFYRHSGVNWGSLLRAFKQNVQQGEIVSGASTISMQVIRLSRNNPKRTYLEKALEILRALRLEMRYSKEEILALYAAHAPMGGNVVGLNAASWRYFGRAPEALSWSETAALAILPNAPGIIYPGRSTQPYREKRDRLLSYLHQEGHFDALDLELAMAESLPSKPKALPTEALHLMNFLEKQHGQGNRYETKVQRQLQIRIRDIIAREVEKLESNHIYNAAVLVSDVRSGEVIAYLGNAPGDGHGRAVDIIQSPRSTGSILKPLLFASLLDEGELLRDELVKDIPTNFNGYQPENFTKTYMGAVPASEALIRSLNVPPVRLLQDYGLEKFHAELKELGFEHFHRPSSHYGLSIILGGGECTLWELNRCYAGLAKSLIHTTENSGAYPDYTIEELRLSSDHTPKTFALKNSRMYDASSIYQMLDVMRGVNRPDTENGWEFFGGSTPVAWKTGTSFGHRDAWAVGITGEHVIAVWVGNASGEGRPGLTGARAAGPILFQVVERLPKSAWFDRPWDEMHEIAVCAKSGARLGMHCKEERSLNVGSSGLRRPACSHCSLVFLDESKQHRVSKSCYDGPVFPEFWFELSPAEAWYYRRHHPEYQAIPPWRSTCLDEVGQHNIQMIYPKNKDQIALPIDISGENQEVVLEAAHALNEATLYWHLNQEYLGSTSVFHQMSISPGTGKYTLTLSDDFGEVLEQEISIVHSLR